MKSLLKLNLKSDDGLSSSDIICFYFLINIQDYVNDMKEKCKQFEASPLRWHALDISRCETISKQQLARPNIHLST